VNRFQVREEVTTVDNMYGGPSLGHKILRNARYFSAPDAESVLGSIGWSEYEHADDVDDDEALQIEELVRAGAADAEVEGAL
jgi:hypothetical protein